MSEKLISSEQVAILAERVDSLLNHSSRIEGLIIGISTQQTALSSNLAVQQERLANFEAGQRRLFQLADDHGRELERVVSDVKVHSWTWKLVGVAALSSLGLVGWAFSELRALQATDNRHENRLSIVEFVVGGRTPPIKPAENAKP